MTAQLQVNEQEKSVHKLGSTNNICHVHEQDAIQCIFSPLWVTNQHWVIHNHPPPTVVVMPVYSPGYGESVVVAVVNDDCTILLGARAKEWVDHLHSWGLVICTTIDV